MKHLRLGVVLAAVTLAALWSPVPARAACGSLPYVFTNNNSIVDATTTNANNQFLQGCATQVDNTQIGTAGIYPSQIIPGSVATGTFGGSYPYTFSLNVSNQVPLTILGYTSQTADLLDIFNSGRTTKYVWVDSGGVLRTNQLPVFNGATAMTLSHGTDYVDTSTAQTIGGAKTFSVAPITPGLAFSVNTNGLNLQRAGGGQSILDAQAVAISGVTADLLRIGNSTGGTLFAFDNSGNLGAGAFKAGSSSYGPTNASIGPGGTWGNLLAIGSGNGSGRGTDLSPDNTTTVAGITGTLLKISDNPVANLVTWDISGNEGIAGNYYAASQRTLKTNIADLSFDPLALIAKIHVQQWCYKAEHCAPGEHRNLGPMADDAPLQIVDARRRGVNLNNEVALSMAAIGELKRRLDSLERDTAARNCSPAFLGKVVCDAH